MIIVSSFKDYYDHQAHIYGGGDPKIRYERLAFDTHSANQLPSFTVDTDYEVPRVPDFYAHRHDYQYKWLVVMAKKYLVVQPKGRDFLPTGPWRVLNAKDHPILYSRIVSATSRPSRYTDSDYLGRAPHEGLLRLSRNLRAPVFAYQTMGYHRVMVDRNVPILGDMGFASLYEPQQLYQDLAYFMGNTLRESPDLAPPSVMTNSERIVQHGFDLKQSFRHRR